MENNNILQNLFIQQFNQSDSIAYNKGFTANTSDYNFQLLDNAYRNTGKIYARIKIAGTCLNIRNTQDRGFLRVQWYQRSCFRETTN